MKKFMIIMWAVFLLCAMIEVVVVIIDKDSITIFNFIAGWLCAIIWSIAYFMALFKNYE